MTDSNTAMRTKSSWVKVHYANAWCDSSRENGELTKRAVCADLCCPSCTYGCGHIAIAALGAQPYFDETVSFLRGAAEREKAMLDWLD